MVLSSLLQFLEISVLVSLVAAIGGFVFQRSFQFFLNRNLEQVKNENRKDEIEFTEFKQRQLQALEQLYEKLTVCDQEMRTIIHPNKGDPGQEKLESTAEALDNFHAYYEKKRIYFPDAIDEKLDDFHSELKQNFTSFKNLVVNRKGIRDSDVQKKRGEKHDEIWKKIDDETSEMREEIRQETKQIMRSKEPQI